MVVIVNFHSAIIMYLLTECEGHSDKDLWIMTGNQIIPQPDQLNLSGVHVFYHATNLKLFSVHSTD